MSQYRQRATVNGGNARTRLLQDALDACIDRRTRGDAVSDQEIIAAHPHLMPELADELRKLALIESARQRADSADALPLNRTLAPQHPQCFDYFPGYRVLEEIHRGGQGVVFKAVQEATRRTVAVKVTRAGWMATDRDVARFEQEVQILAGLKHPNIVTIHDSGVAAGGSFYFVMDYVSGESLDAWIERRTGHPGRPKIPSRNAAQRRDPTGVRQTLDLFVKICDAVAAAHLRGVIHRDIKPSNIRIDDAGEPRILDFGLAKLQPGNDGLALGGSSKPVMTETGQFVGSLPWSSPEQASGTNDVDVRSDVYSLGVVLYQMLTGRFPYNILGTVSEVVTRILNDQPIPPSKLGVPLDDEAQTIVLKCLAKQKERRYQSAGELSQDIKCYLAGQPIEAKRDSSWYVLKKTLARRKGAVSVAAAFALLVLGSLVSLGVMYRKQGQAYHRARQETAKAQEITEFLQDLLAATNPFEGLGGREVTVSDVLERAAARVQDELSDQPEVAAAIHATIGNSYRSLGLYAEARPHLESALSMRHALFGDQHVEVAASLRDLGRLDFSEGNYRKSESLLNQSLAMYTDLIGEETEEAAEVMTSLRWVLQTRGRYTESEYFARRKLQILTNLFGEDDSRVGDAQNDLAFEIRRQGRFDEAKRHLDIALRILRSTQDRSGLASALDNLGELLRTQGDFDGAINALTECLQIQRPLLGDDHPHLASTLISLAHVYADKSQYTEAETLYREALQIYRKRLGDSHRNLATALIGVARCELARGDDESVEKHLLEALEIYRKSLGDRHKDVAVTLNNLAFFYQRQGRLDAAEPLLMEALSIYREVLGPNHAFVAMGLRNLGDLYAKQGRIPDAIAALRESEAVFQASTSEHPSRAAGLEKLAGFLIDTGELNEAENALTDALRIRLDRSGTEPLPLAHTLGKLVDLLESQQRWQDAADALKTGYETLDSQDTPSPDTEKARERISKRLAEVYEQLGEPDLASQYRPPPAPPNDRD